MVLEFQSRHSGALPDTEQAALGLRSIAKTYLPERGIDPSLLTDERLQCACCLLLLPDLILVRTRTLALTATTELSPSCAVIGGVLGQDILNALGGREAPLMNFFVFDGELCELSHYVLHNQLIVLAGTGAIYDLGIVRA